MPIKQAFRTSLIYIVCTFIYACAQIVNPTGGSKDEKRPVVVGMKPENESTLFLKNKITIKFDEFIQLNNPDEQIVISPPFAIKPTFINKGKVLEITLKDTLKQNTTYTINFGNAVGDNRENNIISGLSYVFSTGTTIDSNKISGVLKQAFNTKPEKDFTIGLYKAFGFIDTIIHHIKPFYLTKTDDNGNFSIYNLPIDSFVLIAFKDDNKNLKYDKNESFAYHPNVVNTLDSSYYTLYSYAPNIYEPGRIIDTFSNESNKVVALIYKPLKTSFTDQKDRKLYTKYVKQGNNIDTFYLFTANYEKDSIIPLRVLTNGMIHNLSIKNRSLFKPSKFSYTYTKQVELGDSIRVRFNSPLLKFDKSRIKLLKDSNQLVYNIIQTSPFELIIYYNLEEKSSYQLQFLDSAFVSVYNEFSKKDKHLFTTKSYKDYANLILHIQTKTQRTYPYILQITDNEEKNIAYSYQITSNRDINISNIIPGTYQIKIIHDTNSNGNWDNGDFIRRIQPEKVVYHQDKLVLKAYWDLDQNVLID